MNSLLDPFNFVFHMIKGSKGSLWLRNIQLGGFGMVFGLAGMAVTDGATVNEKGWWGITSSRLLNVILIA